MESFPEDLLVGVFPLVFAINATQPQQAQNSDALAPSNSGDSEASGGSRRGRFDKFLDAMVASLLMGDADAATGDSGHSEPRSRSSLLLDDGAYSSDEEFIFDLDPTSLRRQRQQRPGSFSTIPGFGGRRSITQQRNNSVGSQPGGAAGPSGAAAGSYAKALTMGQSFFERARIESYGTTHGFPPSKDPDGSKNLATRIPAAVMTRDVNKLKEMFRDHPLDGILPAGWLEKHVHALPSIILVVCTVTSTAAQQTAHDKHLFQTIEHLAYSLAPKRKCKIHVVGLMEDDVTNHQGKIWSQAILDHIEGSDHGETNAASDAIRVTLLHASSDLESIDAGLPPGPALKRLHDSVKEASLLYYLQEARRTKEKLFKLISDNSSQQNRRRNDSDTSPPPDPILPLVIRYCVKIAFFYEFQLKHEKSLRFLAEAYRHTCRYYQYLQSRPETDSSDAVLSFMDLDSAESSLANEAANVTGDSVEVELSTAASSSYSSAKKAALWRAVVPPPPADMLHQCRAVAEWLNLKLLLSGFSSRTESGLMAASGQWREHQRTFCSPSSVPRSVIPSWLDWSFVTRQRLVFCQLAERYPPTSCVDLDSENDELLALCSSWRTSLATAEGYLRLAREIDRIKSSSSNQASSTDRENNLRDPFIGALDSGGLSPLLREECKVQHREKALDLVLKTIGLYEGELRREKRGFYAEDSFRESSSSRSGARMFYLAGGILLGMNKHEEAVQHLEKATKYAKGWRDLELSIRKMLIECYEKHVPSHSDPMANESSQTLASMILDSYFNAEMSSQDLRRALGQFSTISGGGSLKWYRESFNDEDPSMPFTFEVTFPENIFATIGDTVKASIFIKSNLDYAVHVNSVVLLSLAGELPISSNDLMRAINASEGSDGGIIIQRKFEITIETELVLPKDLSIIAADDSGNGGELQGVAGKGSFSKSARPRTAGLTSAGGARLLSADQLSRENKVTQGWSLRFLGGKPLKCDGLRVAFYPVQVGGASGSSDQVPVIELTIDKKKPRTAADIKRTPFETENYIASAWSRPRSLPLSRGPRSLRVLGPQPQMVITNLTESSTDGKALEGTVNRVVLKLQAGPTEHCADITYRVSCFSVLITADGNTKRLVSEEDLSSEAETSVDMKNPKYRTPVLVSENPASESPETVDYGYPLPSGWKLAESGQGFDGKLRVLKGGDSNYITLDFFRPSPITEVGEAEAINASLCKTDIYVTVSYRKERPTTKRRTTVRGGRGSQRGGRGASGRGRGRSFASAASEEFSVSEPSMDFSDNTKAAPDDVSLDYSGTIVWSKPMEASFSPGVDVSQPCGISHPSNKTDLPSESDTETDFVASDGGTVAARCTLHTQNASDELRTEIVGVRFKKNLPDSPLQVDLVGSLGDENNQLYKAPVDDICRILASGSKFSVAYSVQVSLSEDEEENVSQAGDPLGAIEVDWMPFPMQLPPDAAIRGAFSNSHGPLRLPKPATILFQGPTCNVEASPFRAKLSIVPPTPAVASPFEVIYIIENTTSIHQTLSLSMTEPTNTNSEANGLLFSGLISGQLVLAPKETQTVSYTVVATQAGKAFLPPLSIVSSRYSTWIVHEKGKKPLYIFP